MRQVTVTRLDPETKRLAAIVLLALLIVLALTASLAHHPYAPLEQAIFDAIYGLPNFFQPIFLVVTQLGSGWALAGLLGSLIYIKRKGQALLLALAGAGTFVMVELLKHLYARPRPYALSDEVIRRDPLTSGGFGFPSGHAAMAMVIGIFIMVFVPKIPKIIVTVAVLLVGLSRIYLGMHAPLDIIAGYAVGAAVCLPFFGVQLLAKHKSKA